MLCNTAQYTKVYEIGPSSRMVREAALGRRGWVTRAAELTSDMQLLATDTVVSAPPTTQASEVVTFQDRSSNQQRTQPADPWKARTTSSSSGHDAPILDDNDNSTANRHNGSDICDIQFGLSPNTIFDRAENRGSYREFENRK